jgi:hypothetical protein
MISSELKFRRLPFRQDLLDCFAERPLLVETEDGRSDLASPRREGPARFVDFSTESVPIEILATNLQPGAQGSLSNRRASGETVPSLIRMIPSWWCLALGLSPESTVTHCSGSWRLRLDVSVGLYLCNWRSFKPPSSCHFSLQGH